MNQAENKDFVIWAYKLPFFETSSTPRCRRVMIYEFVTWCALIYSRFKTTKMLSNDVICAVTLIIVNKCDRTKIQILTRFQMCGIGSPHANFISSKYSFQPY